MGFKRQLAAPEVDRDSLTRAKVGIGMLFAAKPSPLPNIEDTLVAASAAGMERGDLRVLAVLTTWLGVHSQHINADRLVRALTTAASPRVLLYLSGSRPACPLSARSWVRRPNGLHA